MRASDEVGATHERDEQSMLGRGSYGMTKRWLIRNYLDGGVYYKKELPFSRRTFFEIHTLLGDKLLPPRKPRDYPLSDSRDRYVRLCTSREYVSTW